MLVESNINFGLFLLLLFMCYSVLIFYFMQGHAVNGHFGVYNSQTHKREGYPQLGYVLKVTRHLCFKNSTNLRPQDIMAFILANKPSFQSLNVQKL